MKTILKMLLIFSLIITIGCNENNKKRTTVKKIRLTDSEKKLIVSLKK